MLAIKKILEYLDSTQVEYSFYGDKNVEIDGFSSLKNYTQNTVTWIKTPQILKDDFDQTKYKLLIVQDEIAEPKTNIITSKESKHIFFDIIDTFFSLQTELADIGENTYISSNVILGNNVKIGHNCTIDGQIEIEDNTIVYNNVVIINKVHIGKNCIIQSGCIIGHDDFAYTTDDKGIKHMIKHYGGVNIESDVFIGGNCEIGRGTIDDTIIKKGTKIDSLCQISHNVNIGENVSIVTGSSIYGSADIGDNAYIASAIIKNQIRVGKNAFIGMGSVVLNNVLPNAVVVGNPAKLLKYTKSLTMRTDRLLLRELKGIDAKDMFEFTSNPACFRYLKNNAHINLSQANEYIENELLKQKSGKSIIWAICDERNNKLVGTCKLYNIAQNNMIPEVGYMINPKYQGRGIATEALENVLKFAFEELEIDEVRAWCNSQNMQSEKLLRGVGMTFKSSTFKELINDQNCEYKEFYIKSKKF